MVMRFDKPQKLALPVLKRRSYALGRALHLKPFVSRLSVAMLICASFTLVILTKADHQFARNIRLGLTEIASPVFAVMIAPLDAAKHAGNKMEELASIHAQNQSLKQDNAALLQWQEAARQLQAENAALRELLYFTPLEKLSYISGRIVGDVGGPYQRAALINAGENEGIKNQQAVVNEKGLVGRIIETSPGNARVLLITDINSRIPVITETSRTKAILAGNNTDKPSLIHLPEDSTIAEGERIITAGDGGIIPPGLPVGVVSSMENGGVQIQSLVDWYRLEYISVVNFNF